MVQVIVKRENQKATVECSEVKGYIIGNGPSRAHINLDELRKDGIVYGCNALYRDWEPDFLFANDFRMVSEIHKDKYKGKAKDKAKYNSKDKAKFKSKAKLNTYLKKQLKTQLNQI